MLCHDLICYTWHTHTHTHKHSTLKHMSCFFSWKDLLNTSQCVTIPSYDYILPKYNHFQECILHFKHKPVLIPCSSWQGASSGLMEREKKWIFLPCSQGRVKMKVAQPLSGHLLLLIQRATLGGRWSYNYRLEKGTISSCCFCLFPAITVISGHIGINRPPQVENLSLRDLSHTESSVCTERIWQCTSKGWEGGLSTALTQGASSGEAWHLMIFLSCWSSQTK